MDISNYDTILKQPASEELSKKEVKTTKYGKAGSVFMEWQQQKWGLHL
jgi:hypothetical protein